MTQQHQDPGHQRILSQANERLQAAIDAIPGLTALVAERRAHLHWKVRPTVSTSAHAKYSKHDDATQGTPKMLLKQAEAALTAKESEVRTARDHLASVERQITVEEAAAATGE